MAREFTPGAPLPDDIAAQLPLGEANRQVRFQAAASGKSGEIWLLGDIGWEITAASVKDALAALGQVSELAIRIHSGGGSVLQGFAIYNMLARHPAVKTVHVEGVAASMASFIAMVGQQIVMPANSFLMIHNPSVGTYGTAEDIRKTADVLDQLRAPMVATYAARTGQTPDAIQALLDAETWMGADDAKAAGFCDQVAAAIQVAATVDLTRFGKIPRALVPTAFTPSKPGPAGPERNPTVDPMPAPAPGVPLPVAALPPVLQPAAPAALAIATLAELQGIATRARLDSDWIVAQLAGKVTLDTARDLAIDAVAARNPAAPINPANPRATIISDARDVAVEFMAAALAHRSGVEKTLPDGAREYRGLDMVGFAAACIDLAGGKSRGLTRSEIARAAMGIGNAQASAGLHSTTDFPNLLANTANKALRNAYEAAPRVFTQYCSRRDLKDFKTFSEVALSGAPTLTVNTEAQDIQWGTISDGAETWSVSRYGKMIGISFQSVVNDDMDGFSRMPTMFANSASNLECQVVADVFNNNAAMADTVALFHATHSNLGSGAITVANIGALQTAMRKQTAPNGQVLGLGGRFLLVPADLETTALSFFAQNIVPSAPGTANVNPWVSAMQVLVDPRLTGSTTAYFLIADPGIVDTIRYGYLEGESGPMVTSWLDQESDGLIVKCTHNFGAKAIDYRGMQKSSGT